MACCTATGNGEVPERKIESDVTVSKAYSFSLNSFAQYVKKITPHIEKIGMVALAAFAMYKNPPLFLVFSFVGVVLGLGMHEIKFNQENHCGDGPSTCDQGLLQKSLGIQLPRVVVLSLLFAGAVQHMDHHGEVSIFTAGIYYGAKIGIFLGQNIFKA